MSTKDWLMRGWKLNREINQLLEERTKALSLACKTTGRTDKERVRESIKNTAEDKLVRYSDYSRMIDGRVVELYQIKKEILEAINKVEDGKYRTLLIARYINFKTWERIAVDMDLTFQWVHILHGRALQKINVFSNS